MMRRLSVLTFLVVVLVTQVSTPRASSKSNDVWVCRAINLCEVECCNGRGLCVVFSQTDCDT
jgi:hypothetical protein